MNTYDTQTPSVDGKTIPMKMWSKDFITSERISLCMTPNMSSNMMRFVECSEIGCNSTSKVGEFDAYTLRLGLGKCLTHLDKEDVERAPLQVKNHKNIIPVYYDIELSDDGKIEQIGARTDEGYTFSGLIRTSVRTNKSPILRVFRADIWNILVQDAKSVMESFVDWLETLTINSEKGSSKNVKIVLIAHYGVLFDHLHVVRTMLKHGIEPPDVLLSDSVVIFKMMMGKNETAKLGVLRDKYVPWVDHVAHDADSDAGVLMALMNVVFEVPTLIYARASVTSRKYMDLVGLNLYERTKTMEQRIRDATSS